MSKKMKITLTAAVMAVIMLVMSVAVYAATHRWYEELHIASGTVILKGSFQASKNSSNTEFTNIYSTLRFDPSGTGGPGYSVLDLKIVLDGYWGTTPNYYEEVIEHGISIGNYIHSYRNDISDRYNVNKFDCYYYAKTPQSNVYNMNFTINVDVDTPAD